MEKILMGRDNPEGAKLEELMGRLVEEIRAKSALLKEDSDLARYIVESNNRIIQKLTDAKEIQQETMREIERQRGPDKGLLSPRVL